jgi:fibronectin type 3 domain-containing protein
VRNERAQKSGIVTLLILLLALTAATLFHSSGRSKPHKVTLRWNPPTLVKKAKIAGYNVYRSKIPGGSYIKIATGVRDPTYVDEHVDSGTTYYYVVTAVDESNRESHYSNEVKAKIP